MMSRHKTLYGTILNKMRIVFVILIAAGFTYGCAPKSTPPPAVSATTLPEATSIQTSTVEITSVSPTAPLADQIATPIPLGGKDLTNFTFVVCGDVRGGVELYAKLLRNVEEEDVAFMVNTGDLVERGRESNFQAFAEIMDNFSLPFFPVAGNHDTDDGFLDEFLQYSGAPAEHYSLDYGLGHFVFVDSHLGVLSSRELSWLEADLAATSQPLKMVFLHHPPIDPRGKDNTFHGGNDEFMTLMEQYGVSFVFAGHIHSYLEEVRDGVQYIISGGAGAPINPDDFYHYVRVSVDGSEVSYEVVKLEPPDGEGQ